MARPRRPNDAAPATAQSAAPDAAAAARGSVRRAKTATGATAAHRPAEQPQQPAERARAIVARIEERAPRPAPKRHREPAAEPADGSHLPAFLLRPVRAKV